MQDSDSRISDLSMVDVCGVGAGLASSTGYIEVMEELMKKPRPLPPSDAPPGTVWFGGPIGWFSISLRVNANELDPDAVTVLFGIEPTESWTKGVPIVRDDGTLKRTPKFGHWSIQLSSTQTDEWDVEEAVRVLLARLPSELSLWRDVAVHGSIELSIGLSLDTSNQGLSFEPDLIGFLGERGVRLSLDIYEKES